MLQGDFT
jgi:hypothetical protein